jgi:hypothetical protein
MKNEKRFKIKKKDAVPTRKYYPRLDVGMKSSRISKAAGFLK